MSWEYDEKIKIMDDGTIVHRPTIHDDRFEWKKLNGEYRRYIDLTLNEPEYQLLEHMIISYALKQGRTTEMALLIEKLFNRGAL